MAAYIARYCEPFFVSTEYVEEKVVAREERERERAAKAKKKAKIWNN